MPTVQIFASVLMPGIALLVLSTTIRIGNVRMTLMNLSQSIENASDSHGYNLFEQRLSTLGNALGHLYISLACIAVGSLFAALTWQWPQISNTILVVSEGVGISFMKWAIII